MRRRNISGKHHARKFARGRRSQKAINAPGFYVRGGIRL